MAWVDRELYMNRLRALKGTGTSRQSPACAAAARTSTSPDPTADTAGGTDLLQLIYLPLRNLVRRIGILHALHRKDDAASCDNGECQHGKQPIEANDHATRHDRPDIPNGDGQEKEHAGCHSRVVPGPHLHVHLHAMTQHLIKVEEHGRQSQPDEARDRQRQNVEHIGA